MEIIYLDDCTIYKIIMMFVGLHLYGLSGPSDSFIS